jgi:hypothetical protein
LRDEEKKEEDEGEGAPKRDQLLLALPRTCIVRTTDTGLYCTFSPTPSSILNAQGGFLLSISARQAKAADNQSVHQSITQRPLPFTTASGNGKKRGSPPATKSLSFSVSPSATECCWLLLLTAALALTTSKVSGPVIVFLQAHLTTTTHHSPFTTHLSPDNLLLHFHLIFTSLLPFCIAVCRCFLQHRLSKGTRLIALLLSGPSFLNSLLSKRCFPASLGTLPPILSCSCNCSCSCTCTQSSHHFFLERLVPSIPPPKPSLPSIHPPPFSLSDQIK